MSVPGVILAGGAGRRMGGGDKPLRRLGGQPLLAHVIARLAPQLSPLALNANGAPERFAAFGLKVLPDPVAGLPGPLAGVLAAMQWAAELGASAVLTAPGDTPFLPPDLVARLAAAREPGQIACAACSGRAHPTVALWPVELAPRLAVALQAGQRRVELWAREEGLVTVAFADETAFLNLNTPEDLAAAEAALLRQEGSTSFS